MDTTFGIIGLGKMGGGLAQHAIDKGFTVIGYDPNPVQELREYGVVYASDLQDLMNRLPKPRKVFLWIPAGSLVDEMSDRLAALMEPGDVIIDGGNSYWGDSIRRAEKYSAQKLHFLDLGTSGGMEGARNCPCFMIGGPKDSVALVEPILQKLAIEGGYVHAGESGSGHYVKLVHNGIEFGMLQAIGEGMELLERFPNKLAVADTLECWRHGSVIRSWLIDLMARAYKGDPAMQQATGYIEDTGEVNWLVSDAMTFDVPVPVIAQAVMMLMRSRESSSISDKSIIEMRHQFGGHPFGPEPGIRKEREHGRVGPLYSLPPDKKSA